MSYWYSRSRNTNWGTTKPHTSLRSKFSRWLLYKGSSDNMVYNPHPCVKWATTIAQKGSELKIAFHGIEVCCSFSKKINKTAKSLFNQTEDSNIRIKWGYATSLLSFWKGKKYYIGIENCFLSSVAMACKVSQSVISRTRLQCILGDRARGSQSGREKKCD